MIHNELRLLRHGSHRVAYLHTDTLRDYAALLTVVQVLARWVELERLQAGVDAAIADLLARRRTLRAGRVGPLSAAECERAGLWARALVALDDLARERARHA